jgi:cytochrome c2
MAYLCIMNKQVGYITTAHLVLAIVIGSYLFISKIPFATGKQTDIITSSTATTIIPANGAKGKSLFMSKCASCHNLSKNLTGPGLVGFEERGPWADRNKVYEWIRNPAAFMKKDAYTKNLKTEFGSMMTASPDLTNEEIDAIIDYINYPVIQSIALP